MKLIDQYSELLKNEQVFRAIQDTFEDEVTLSHEAWEDLFNQFFISTATWGLYKWEQFAGLPISENLDNETRRGNILAALRSRATSTKERIKLIAQSYSNGECQVVEKNEDYIFYIKFSGEKGIPKRLDELKKSIDNVKPAHLAYEFIFSFLIWDEFDNYNKTWDQWDALNLTWDELEVYSEETKENFAPTISEFKASAITKNSIEISYKMQDEKPGTVRHYITLESFYSDKNITEVISIDSEGYKYLITGLQPKTMYRIKIKCTDEEGLSNESEFIRATTHEEIVNLAPVVSNLKCISKDMNNIDIQYDAQDEDMSTVKHYITVNDLYVEKDITSLISQIDGKYRYKIEGLTEGISYEIKIKLEDKEGLLSESSPISVITPEAQKVNQPPKVTNLKVTGATDKTIDIEYTVEDESVDSVRHYLYVTGIWIGRNITSEVIKQGNVFKYTIPGLTKNKTYDIKIEANDGEFKGSATIEGKTGSEVAPPEPEPIQANIVGFKIDESNSNSKGAVTYIEDNANYAPAEGINFNAWEGKWPFNLIKPCFLKQGKVVGYLKKFDYTRMEDGTEIDDMGDVMIEYPKMYWSFKREGNSLEVRISDKKIDDTYVCPAFTRKGIEKDHAYIGGYYASEINGRMASLPGKNPITNKGKIALRNLAGSNGEGYEQLIPYLWSLEQIMGILLYKSLDSQRNLGIGPNYALIKAKTGATKLFGPLSGDSSQFSNLKFLGAENLWGSGTTTLDGIEIVGNQLKINQTGHPADGTEVVGDFDIGTWSTSRAGYMSKAFGTNKGCFFPLEFSGSDSTYYADDCYVESDNSDYTCYVGGDASGGLYKNGLFYLQQFTDPANGGGGRLYFGRLTYVG